MVMVREATVAAGERGAILLVVLMLTVVFALLSTTLLSTAEMTLRVQANASDMERAERAAQSGVEWAAALVKQDGLRDATRTVTMPDGTVFRATVRATASPQLLGDGVARGVKARFGASAALEPGAYPHAFLAFGGASRLDQDLAIDGDAYFDGASPFNFNGSKLRMAGNLHLVTTTSVSTFVVHTSGSTSYGVSKISEPSWNTLPFTLGAWSVPVITFSGGARVSNRSLTGIVVVNMLGGQKFTFDNCTINGTIVVPAVYPPILDILGSPALVLENGCSVTGGTPQTGNLAILAPTVDLQTRQRASTISGVSFVRNADLAQGTAHNGLLILRGVIEKIQSTVQFSRPVGFTPWVPVGINWTGAAEVRMRWEGRQ